MAQPELDRRRSFPPHKKPRTKLAVGLVETLVPHDQLHEHLNDLRERDLARQLRRAGKITSGIVTTTIRRSKEGYKVRIAVLGLTDLPVQHSQPQVPGGRGEWRTLDDTIPTVVWTAAYSGNDCPKFSPDALRKLLQRAMPYPYDDSGIAIKRISPFGTAREYVSTRGPWPAPIKLPRNLPRSYITDKVDSQLELLRRSILRTLVRKLCKPLDIPRGKQHALIAEAIRACNAGGWTDPNWIIDAMHLPAGVLYPVNEYAVRLNGFLGPPGNGGPEWQDLVSMLSPPTGDGPRGYARVLVMRTPGRQRKLSVIHDVSDASKYGGALPIGDTGAWIQPMDQYLDYVVSRCPDAPKTKTDLYERLPRLSRDP